LTELEREIKKYHIASITTVRASGSRYDEHERRCLWDICGKPSLQWVIETLKASKYIEKIIVSSEDKKILDLADKLEVTTVTRPLYTALDMPRNYREGRFARKKPRSQLSQEPSIYTDYDLYTWYYLEEIEGYIVDVHVGAEANRPLGTVETLDKVIEAFFKDEEATTAWSFYPILPYLYTINPKNQRPFPLFYYESLDKQLYPPLYRVGPFTCNGKPAIRSSAGQKIAPVFCSPEEGLDMHNKEDLFLANCYMKRRLEKLEKGR